jgi:divalent metal cation (Fe/Co/Zn/Cd) transporter
MKKFGVFNKLLHTQAGKLKWLRYTFGIIITLIIISVSWMIAKASTPPINSFLDLIGSVKLLVQQGY